MFNCFYPDEEIKSVYHINFQKKKEEGYEGVIFDIDNTLVMHGADADENSIYLFEELRKIGFSTVLMSNNKEERVKRFNSKINSLYIFKANKPAKGNYLKAMSMMGTTKKNTLFVGDQLFTDVWGAKRVGIHAVLVEPIDKQEEIQIILKRYLEKIVLYFYRKERGKRK